jgi:TonB family protein
MSLTNYMGDGAYRQPQRRRSSFVMSLAAHGAAFFVLMHTPDMKPPVPAPSEYKQVIEGHEQKLVWYRFNKDLPDVTPRSAKKSADPLKALNRARQEIVASPANAPQRTRFVWAPAPELRDIQPLESPNLLAVRLADPVPPPKPFVAPPDVRRQETAQIETPPDAPKLEARALPPAAVPSPPKLAKQFVEPAPLPVRKETLRVEPAPDAPLLEAKALRDNAIPAPDKLVKQFVAPPKKVPVKLAEVAPAPEAPPVVAGAGPLNATAPLDYKFKGPVRPFTAPATSRPSAATAKPAFAESPPSLSANTKDLNLAVVSLHPVDLAAALPTAASPAKFSAAPQIRPEGADAAGDGKGISVPDLFVRGADKAQPNLVAQAYAAPTSADNLREAARRVAQNTGQSNALLARAAVPEAERALPPSGRAPAALKVSGAPTPQFNGRDVYMMAIQMPNLTSYSGSWLMWYADRAAKEAGLSPVSPPVPLRKVDPKYVASAQSDKVEGKVQFLCIIDREGRVSGIQLVHSLDPRLNDSAEEALSRWVFDPALRDGVAVEVDVLVEIPFHLEHIKPVTY